MTNLEPILTLYENLEGALLPVLHAVQKRDGHICEEAMRAIAEHLNLSRAEVFGVVSFYHDFRLEPSTKATLKICRAEACQARGAEQLIAQADAPGMLEPIYCLGLCSVGPVALTPDGKVHARLNTASLKNLIEALS